MSDAIEGNYSDAPAPQQIEAPKHTEAENLSALGFDNDPAPEPEPPAETVDQETGEVLPPTDVMAASLIRIGERTLGEYSADELQAIVDGKGAQSLKEKAALLRQWKTSQPALI